MLRTDFNRDWRFSRKNEEDKAVLIHLPHDAMLTEVRSAECKNGVNTGFFPGGEYVYTKKWLVPAEWQTKTVTIEFEGVYRNSEVFLNGKRAGGWPYGYTNFYVNCDGFLQYGVENEIIVTVDNSQEPNSRWYSGSGIYRNVTLLVGNPSHLDIDGVKIKTLAIHSPVVQVKTAHHGGEVEIQILSQGKKIATSKGDLAEISLLNAKLWSAEQPNLYECRVILKENGSIVDEETIVFGIRLLSWSAKEGFRVNGVETKLRGSCVHHDNGVLGACDFPDAEERRVRLLKEAGFNAIRSAHNPISKAMASACDRLGVYIMDEAFDMWYIHKTKFDYVLNFDEWHEKDLRAMVEKDYNHPSVIMYSIGNEVSETAQDRGIGLTREMTEFLHSHDDTRPVTCGINLMLNTMNKKGKGIYKENAEGFDTSAAAKKLKKDSEKPDKLAGSALFNAMMNYVGKYMNNIGKSKACDVATKDALAALDIAGYNYGSGRYPIDGKQYPERVVVGAETFPPHIVENWKAVQKQSNLIGDFMWVGYDYLGEGGIGAFGYASRGGMRKKYPYISADSGLIDIIGNSRPEVWLNRSVWGMGEGKPYIGVEPLTHAAENGIHMMWRTSDAVHSWSWKGYENLKAKIVVYSSASRVALLLNGVALGTKKVKGFETHFQAKYQPGELVAIAYDLSGTEIGRDVLKTASEKTLLTVRAEKTELRANGQDLAFVTIRLTDETGILKASNDQRIDVKVEGAGTLQGFGSANPFTEETFEKPYHDSFYGQALAVVRAGYAKGSIKLTVSSLGCQPVELTLQAK